MEFNIITIFPELVNPFSEEGLLKKAIDKKIIDIKIHNLRSWANNKHSKVDDRPFGGGLGMVMQVEPIFNCLQDIKKDNSAVIVFTPRGKKFNQTIAKELSSFNQLIFVCGRYEGIDERVSHHLADYNLSVGNYVLMGGELPAMIVTETVARLIPGVIGKKEFLAERQKEDGFLEYPQYTRPEEFTPPGGRPWRVPAVLLSGDHKKISAWKDKKRKLIK
jgi:tRNA (guanine37-N1)-methyltransferase